MNSSAKNTSTIVEDACLPEWVPICVTAVGAFLLTGNCIGISLLLRFLSRSEKSEKTPSQTFIFTTAVVSLLATVTGIPIAIIAATNRYKPVRLEVITRLLQSRVLILCFSLVLHYLTCITTERYLTITLKTHMKISVKTSRRVIAVVTVYVLLLWGVIVADDLCSLSGNEPHISCTLQRRMAYKYTSKSKVPVAIITIWMSSCNAILCTTTTRTMVYINKVLQSAEERFGVSSKRVETRRLAVVYALALFFTLIWVPYGIVSAQRSKMELIIAKILEIFFETACYASFFVLPFAFYVMDKRFWEYVKNLWRRRESADDQPNKDRSHRMGTVNNSIKWTKSIAF